MSVRVEWMNTRWLSACVARHGEEIGEFAVTRPLALVLSGDEVTVIEGTRAELLRVVRRLEAELSHAGVPEYDRDNRCTQCGEHLADPHAPECPAGED